MIREEHFIDAVDTCLARMRLLTEGALALFENRSAKGIDVETAETYEMLGQALFDLRDHIRALQERVREEGNRTTDE